MSKTTTSAEPKSSPDPQGWAGTAEQWGGRTYDAVLPSGMQVSYQLPSLGEMATLGELPTELLEVAYLEWATPGIAAQLAAAPLAALKDDATKKERDAAEKASKTSFQQIAALNRHVIAAALVEPKMTVEQLELVPFRDLEMLSVLVNRGSGVDAAGRYVGVVPLDRFQIALAAHGHDACPADCTACQAAARAVSQVRG